MFEINELNERETTIIRQVSYNGKLTEQMPVNPTYLDLSRRGYVVITPIRDAVNGRHTGKFTMTLTEAGTVIARILSMNLAELNSGSIA